LPYNSITRMSKNKLRVSIIIPAYNEEGRLSVCLEAIARQTVRPYEVIVVDNNSKDNTAEEAKQFAFVTLISEPKQGLVHARNRGFNAAKGEIIGRIDADTRLPADWVEQIQCIFVDERIKAVSGSLHFYDVGWSKIIDKVDSFFRRWIAKHMSVHQRIFLFGSNMAVRRSAWVKVRDSICNRGGIHEDADLALHLSDKGQLVVYNPELLASVSGRRIDTNLLDLCRYLAISPITYIRHGAKEHYYMYPPIVVVFLCYPILRILYRSFDSETQHFRLSLLFVAAPVRVNPATYGLKTP